MSGADRAPIYGAPPAGELIDYSPTEFPLARVVARVLAAEDLSRLHRQLDEPYPVFKRENDQSSAFHRRFYDFFNDRVEETYISLVADAIRPRYAEPIAYQRIPTFRVHLPGNVAVGEFHRDRDYQHSDVELNYWIPLTACWGTNTMWVESAPDAGDYRPVAMRYGQILAFNGVGLRHGNHVNVTDHTRVSMDLRVVPMSKYRDSDRLTINTKMRFAIGDYFSLMP